MNDLEDLLKNAREAYDSSIKQILPQIVAAALELSRAYRNEISSKFYFSSPAEITVLSKSQKMIETIASLAKAQGMYYQSSELYYNGGCLLSALEAAEEGGLKERSEALCYEYVIFLSQYGKGSEFAKMKFGEEKKTLLGLVEIIAKKTDCSAAYHFGRNCGLKDKEVMNVIKRFESENP